MDNSLIKRQDAIDAINAYLGLSAVSRTIQNMTSIQEILENLPSAPTDLSTFSDNLWKIAYERGKAEGRKKGKWKEHDSDEDKYDVIKCPCCMHMFTVDSYHWTDIGFVKDDFKFCPNCGADMREGDSE